MEQLISHRRGSTKEKETRERESLRTENWSTPTLIGSVYKDEPAKKTQKINEQ